MKEYRYILVLTLCSLLFVLPGCRPKGILHSWEMRSLLVDLHKTDAMLQVAGYSVVNNTEERTIFYAQVLEKHGVTQAQFDSSLVWYTAHPQLFDKIYPKVLDRLKKEEEIFLAENAEALHMLPRDDEEGYTPVSTQPEVFTEAQLDSVLWITQHGYPHSWKERPIDVTVPLLP